MITTTSNFSDYETAYDFVVSVLREHSLLTHSIDYIAYLICNEGAVVCFKKCNCLIINPDMVDQIKAVISCIRGNFDNYIIVVTRP